MKDKMFKVSVLFFIFVISLVLVASSVNAESSEGNSTEILTLSKGGISINYPSDWGYSKATSNDSIMAISKLDSIDSSKIGQVNINFEKRPIEGDFNTFVNSTYNSMLYDSSFKLISSGEVLLGDKNALEYTYISHNDNGGEREHKAIWFEKGGQAYVMLYSAPVDQFESNSYVFDYILADIQIR